MKRIVLFLFVLFFTFFIKAWGNEPKGYKFKQNIEVGRAREVKTDIDFFSGELHVEGTSTYLAQCFYGKSNPFYRPEMFYHESSRIGYLTIGTQNKELDDIEDNEWFLAINPDIANNVSIRLKAGEANIDLKGCNLTRFDYRMLAGESTINLRNTSVPNFIFNMMAGEANIDLSGKWHNDLEADIKGGVGELNIKVPYNVGVRIFVSGLIGEVRIPFFNRNGKTYTNDAYGKSKHTLFLNVEAGIGEINVTMEE